MANIKIAQLANQTAISDNDLVIVESATSTNKMTVGKFKELLGIQAGGVVESGSNANGRYIKFSDGTMIQRGTKIVNSVTGVSVHEAVLTFPTPFLSSDYQINLTQSYSHGNIYYSILVFGMSANGKLTGSVGFKYGSPFGTWGEVVTMHVDWIAIGRWK